MGCVSNEELHTLVSCVYFVCLSMNSTMEIFIVVVSYLQCVETQTTSKIIGQYLDYAGIEGLVPTERLLNLYFISRSRVRFQHRFKIIYFLLRMKLDEGYLALREQVRQLELNGFASFTSKNVFRNGRRNFGGVSACVASTLMA